MEIFIFYIGMILILFSCWKLGEKFGFPELGQCILQQDYTFMREEKLERFLKVEGIEPSAEGYSKLAIKKQQSAPLPGVEPGTSCTEICYSSLWAIVARLFRSTKICIMFSCFSWSIRWRLQMVACKIRPLTFNLLKPSIIFLAIHDQW